MSLQRQHCILSYLKTLSVGPAGVWTRVLPLSRPALSQLWPGYWTVMHDIAASAANYLGKLSKNEGDINENVTQKVKSRFLKLYRAYPISFNSSNADYFFWSWILKDCLKVQGKKEKVFVLCSRPSQNVKAFSRHSRALTVKKCTEKRDTRAKLLFCQYKPIAFMPFSLTSRSSLRKFPFATWMIIPENVILAD